MPDNSMKNWEGVILQYDVMQAELHPPSFLLRYGASTMSLICFWPAVWPAVWPVPLLMINTGQPKFSLWFALSQRL